MRKVHAVSGADRKEFLQSLVTNDVNKLSEGLVYTALLTPQGKYLADFFLVEDGDRILIDLPEDISEATIKRLSMYRLRADVVIEPTDLIVSRGTSGPPAGSFADPRHPALGWRAYGETDLSDDTDWDAVRVSALVPESGSELTPETFILEAGFERLQGVDFRKGCYVGQEVTARMKHKTTLRKGFVQVEVAGQVPVGTAITKDGKAAGVLHTQSDGKAIAYLRFDRAIPPLQAADAEITAVDLPEQTA